MTTNTTKWHKHLTNETFIVKKKEKKKRIKKILQ